MLEAANVELAQHLAGELGPRRPTHRVEIDWDSSGAWVDITSIVRSVKVNRSLTGDLPSDAGLIDGYTSASLEVELEGVWVDPLGVEWPVVTAFSPFVPGSLREGRKLNRARVRCSMGMVLDGGPVLIPQFVGPLRIVDGAEGDGTITLHGIDPSERLRAPVTLPTYAEFITHAVRRPWLLTINTQWVLDFCLRACGVYASPPPRDEAIIVATGHGGLAAERGFNGAPISLYGTGPRPGLWTEDGHPYAMLGTPENSSGGTVGYMELYGVTDGVTAPVGLFGGQGVGLSCFLHMGNGMTLGSAFENRLFQIRPGNIIADNDDNEYPRLFVSGFGNGDIYVGLTTEAGAVYATPRIPTGSGPWRFLGVHYQFTSNTTLVIRVRMDGQTRTYTLTVPSKGPTHGYRPTLQVNAQLFRAWTNLQVWPSYAPPAAGAWQGEAPHVPQASIARGLNELTHLPDVVGKDAWEVMKAAVAAEFGVHRHDIRGDAAFYTFRPRTDVRPTAVDVELDVRTNLKDAKWSTSVDSVRNVITCKTAAKFHSGEWQTVVKADDVLQFVVPPNTTKRWVLDWPYGAAGLRGGVIVYYTTDDSTGFFTPWNGEVVQGFTYSYGTNFTGEENVNDVRVTYSQIDSRRILLVVSNVGSRIVRLATDADAADPEKGPGEPALRIGGWPVYDGLDHLEELWASDAKVAADLGPRVLPLADNEWRHFASAVRSIMAQLLAALAEEITTISDLEVIGDPRLQEGDVARLRFPGNAVPVTGTVVSVEPTADDSGITTKVAVRPLPAPTLAPIGWSFYIDISHHQGGLIDLPRVKAAGYRGCVARIGQGGGSYVDRNGVTQPHGALVDSWWERFRDEALVLWPATFAGYWYVGNVESPTAQAERCADAIGDTSIPVMLDWEDGAGSWANLLACRTAFVAAGLTVTMLYTNLQSYAGPNGASNIDATGLALVNSRYWLDSLTNPAQDPAVVFADILATNPTFGRVPAYGGTVDALQFTDAGVVYSGGPAIDVNAFPGTEAQLAAMFRAETA